MTGRRLVPALLALAVAGCTLDPTPSMIADCRHSAVVEARPGPRATSLRVEISGGDRACRACIDLLRAWRLDFVEFPSEGSGRLVDRVRLLPRGDPRCAATGQNDRQPRPPLPLFLSVPRRSCLAVERGRESEAAMRLAVTVAPAGDHAMELYEAGPSAGGEPTVRVRDFTIRAIEAAPATCARVLRDFPANPARFVLDRVAERR